MSRIGRMPVAIPAGVTVDIAEGNKVTDPDRRVCDIPEPDKRQQG